MTAIAHEFVHYIQAKYLGEDLTTDGCEMQAAEVQRWFREEYALPKLDVAGEATGTAARLPGGDVPTCVLTPGADGTRAVRCVTGSRAGLRFLGQAKVVGPGGDVLARTWSKAGLACARVDLEAEIGAAHRVLDHLADVAVGAVVGDEPVAQAPARGRRHLNRRAHHRVAEPHLDAEATGR